MYGKQPHPPSQIPSKIFSMSLKARWWWWGEANSVEDLSWMFWFSDSAWHYSKCPKHSLARENLHNPFSPFSSPDGDFGNLLHLLLKAWPKVQDFEGLLRRSLICILSTTNSIFFQIGWRMIGIDSNISRSCVSLDEQRGKKAILGAKID